MLDLEISIDTFTINYALASFGNFILKLESNPFLILSKETKK